MKWLYWTIQKSGTGKIYSVLHRTKNKLFFNTIVSKYIYLLEMFYSYRENICLWDSASNSEKRHRNRVTLNRNIKIVQSRFHSESHVSQIIVFITISCLTENFSLICLSYSQNMAYWWILDFSKNKVW